MSVFAFTSFANHVLASCARVLNPFDCAGTNLAALLKIKLLAIVLYTALPSREAPIGATVMLAILGLISCFVGRHTRTLVQLCCPFYSGIKALFRRLLNIRLIISLQIQLKFSKYPRLLSLELVLLLNIQFLHWRSIVGFIIRRRKRICIKNNCICVNHTRNVDLRRSYFAMIDTILSLILLKIMLHF